MELIVGLCRFSYLGLSDWQVFRHDQSVDTERLETIAETLYAPERMEARFRSFEAICLPSILAQNDPRFLFLVISSPRMPQIWRDRLHAICDPHDQIQIIWAEQPRLGDVLKAPLAEASELSPGGFWQFRLDDDDAVDVNYIKRLRRHIARMKGFREAAISMGRGVNVTLYDGQPKHYVEYMVPNVSAGLAVRLATSGRSIFAFGHFAMRNRISHMVDMDAISALMLKWPSDSRPLDVTNLPAFHKRLTQREFGDHIRSSFPFLQGLDFDSLRATPLTEVAPQD